MSLTAAAPRSGVDAALSAQLPAAAASLAIAPPLAWLLWLSGAVAPAMALGAMALFVFVVASAGVLLLRAASAADLPAAAAWVLGVFATAMAVYALVFAFKLLAATAFAIWAGMVLVARVLAPARASAARRMHGGELLGLVLCAAATLYWCHELAEVPQMLAREGVLTTWVDQFIHGGVISQFGDPRAAGHGAIELADQPWAPYHFASYMLPAAFAWPLDLPGLTLATSLWAPLGFFTLCAGGYSLGAVLAGRAGGVAALAVLTLLPDGASYGLHNRLFGFYWYVIAVPGASYAVGVALLSFAFLRRWLQTGDRRLLLASFCLVAGLALIRVHIFLLAFPGWLVVAALSFGLVRRRPLPFAGAALVAFALFVGSFYSLVPDAVPSLELFLDVTHNQQHPTVYRGLYAGLTELHGAAVAVPVGILLVFLATFSMFAVFYPLSVWLASRSRGLEAIDATPLALSVSYLLLIVTAPLPPHGDATELTQRPFVLLYAVVAIWTVCGLMPWLEARGGWRARRVWLPALVCAALAVVWALHNTVADWRWNSAYRVAEGLPRAARFMRSNWRPGDVLAVQGVTPGLVTTDLAIQVASMTGMPAYLARPYFHMVHGGRKREVATQRYAALGQVAREESAAAALKRLHALGVQWYVVAESDRRGPRWDPERRQAAFVDGMVAVYSTRAVR